MKIRVECHSGWKANERPIKFWVGERVLFVESTEDQWYGPDALYFRVRADDGKVYIFMTNNFSLPSDQIALIYKNRWMIELLFKQIKQNFPLRYFWGESENAIKIQVYSVLIAQLLMVVIRKKAKTKKSFANMITVIRLHLMSYVNLFEFIKDTYSAWKKAHPPPSILT